MQVLEENNRYREPEPLFKEKLKDLYKLINQIKQAPKILGTQDKRNEPFAK